MFIWLHILSNDKDPKFSVGDHVRLSNYKKSFLKGYTLSWSEEVLVIKKVKNTVPWISIIIDLNGEEIDERVTKEFRIKKEIGGKSNGLLLKQKAYDNYSVVGLR